MVWEGVVQQHLTALPNDGECCQQLLVRRLSFDADRWTRLSKPMWGRFPENRTSLFRPTLWVILFPAVRSCLE